MKKLLVAISGLMIMLVTSAKIKDAVSRGYPAKKTDDNNCEVQEIKLKAKVKTSIGTTIKFMACNNHEYLAPKIIKFYAA